MQVGVRPNRLDIQGCRAIAVLMVVAFHAGLPVPGGFVGVDVFFVISGFVITGMLAREWDSTGRINFSDFYLRRFKRLYPALALMIAVTLVISIAILSPLGTQQTAAKTGIAALLIMANFFIAGTTGDYFDASAKTNVFLHTWSLSVEEQFYLVFPMLIAITWTLARGRRRQIPILLVSLCSAVSIYVAMFGVQWLQTQAWGASILSDKWGRWTEALVGFYSPLTRCWEFGLGVLLALAAARLPTRSRGLSTITGYSGAVLLMASLWLISESTPFPGVWTLLPVAATVLLLAAGTMGENPVSRLLSIAALVRIGDWSYSIYLWHWPPIVFAHVLWPQSTTAPMIAAAVSTAPAIASYRWLEMPIRTRRYDGPRSLRVLIARTMAAPLAIAMLMLTMAHAGYWSPNIRRMQTAVLTKHANCETPICTYNENASGNPIYLIGDSTAWHFTEAAIGAGKQLGRPVKVVSIPYCHIKDVYIEGPPEQLTANCRKRYEQTMQWLADQPIGTVVISNLQMEYQRTDRAFGLAAEALTTEPEKITYVLNEGLKSTISTLRKTGQQVVIVQSAPVWSGEAGFDPLRCSLVQLAQSACIGQMSRAEADRIQAVQRPSLRQVAASEGAHIWDPRDFFCGGDTCSSHQKGTDLYKDSIHITAAASQMLSTSLAQTLRRITPPQAKTVSEWHN